MLRRRPILRHNRGYAVPLSLVVAGVTLIMGMTVAQMSAGDLQLANQQYHQERARQMAELALDSFSYNQAASGASDGVVPLTNLVQAHPDDDAQIQIFDNRLGNLPADSGCPVAVPAGYEYWVSTGRARTQNKVLAEVRMGSLVKSGLPFGSSGAQVHHLEGKMVGSYEAIDGSTGLAVNNAAICSTNTTDPADLPGPGFLNITNVLSVDGASTNFAGKAKVPLGAPVAISDGLPASALDNTGGAYAVPNYAPPLVTPIGDLTVSGDTPLPEGGYNQLVLQAGAAARLNGTYHIKQLIVSSNASLRVESPSQAKVYVDNITQTDPAGRLSIRSNAGSAKSFKVNFKPVKPSDNPSPLLLQAANEGHFMLLAPGRKVLLESDATRIIRGSFCCEQLKLQYPSDSPSNRFVYDTSTGNPTSSSGNTSGTTGSQFHNPTQTGGGESGQVGDTGNQNPLTTPEVVLLGKQFL